MCGRFHKREDDTNRWNQQKHFGKKEHKKLKRKKTERDIEFKNHVSISKLQLI